MQRLAAYLVFAALVLLIQWRTGTLRSLDLLDGRRRHLGAALQASIVAAPVLVLGPWWVAPPMWLFAFGAAEVGAHRRQRRRERFAEQQGPAGG